MSGTERLTVAALAERLGAKPDTVRKRLTRIQAGKAKPWPWFAGVERSNNGEWAVLMDPTGFVPDKSWTVEPHLADLKAEVEAARAQIVQLTRLLDQEITDRRALQQQVDETRAELHRAELTAAAAEARLEAMLERPAGPQQPDTVPGAAVAMQLARLWQDWWLGAMSSAR
ncbi:MAG: hypothetical protein SFV21_21720 [Rhodospirillaceae bacterium]|nr:hypothetical protein [Rhodospirillaceae bacterium]